MEAAAAGRRVASLSGSRPQLTRRQAPGTPPPVAGQTARLNGIDLYYEEVGSGDPLLLIAGLGANALSWAPLLPALADRFRVIAVDNRGAGRSAAPQGPYTTRQLADDAASLLAHLGVDRAHVVGFSFGGLVAQELALAHPARVERLALVATNARARPGVMGPWLTFFAQAQERGLDPAGFALWLMPWLLSPAFMANHELVEAALAGGADPYPAPAHGVAGQVAAALAHDARDRLPQIAAPTLVLVGAEDILTPVADAQELAAGIPQARLQVLDRGAHLAFAEHPEAVADALLAFLAA
jgi:3-oxoadipate enol-lactonase